MSIIRTFCKYRATQEFCPQSFYSQSYNSVHFRHKEIRKHPLKKRCMNIGLNFGYLFWITKYLIWIFEIQRRDLLLLGSWGIGVLVFSGSRRRFNTNKNRFFDAQRLKNLFD